MPELRLGCSQLPKASADHAEESWDAERDEYRIGGHAAQPHAQLLGVSTKQPMNEKQIASIANRVRVRGCRTMILE